MVSMEVFREGDGHCFASFSFPLFFCFFFRLFVCCGIFTCTSTHTYTYSFVSRVGSCCFWLGLAGDLGASDSE
jgi:hypothetical protein